MLSRQRLSALFALTRALQGARDPLAIAERFAEQAPRLTGGRPSIWTFDPARDLLVRRGGGAQEERVISKFPDWARVLRDGRPSRTQNALLLPLLRGGVAMG